MSDLNSVQIIVNSFTKDVKIVGDLILTDKLEIQLSGIDVDYSQVSLYILNGKETVCACETFDSEYKGELILGTNELIEVFKNSGNHSVKSFSIGIIGDDSVYGSDIIKIQNSPYINIGSPVDYQTDITILLAHLTDNDNPHNVNKSDIGLSDVPNIDFTDSIAEKRLISDSYNKTEVYTQVEIEEIKDILNERITNVKIGLELIGYWNPSTNLPDISAEAKVDYAYMVDTDYTGTRLGITGWFVGDWAIKYKNDWIKLNASEGVVSINGKKGVISLLDIADIDGLQTALDDKVDDSQVLTDVPSGAVFTDTVYDDTTIQAEVDSNTTHSGLTAGNPHNVTKTEIGLSNVTDDAQIPLTQKGSINGVAELDANRLVPSAQLPSYVDDVLEFANLAGFPTTGESGKIYIALDTNITYRWSGTVYTPIGSDLALGETSSTAYRGDRGKTAYDHSQAGNKHIPTGGTVGQIIRNTASGTGTWQDESDSSYAPTAVLTATATISAWQDVRTDTTSASITFAMPTTLNDGDRIAFTDVSGTWGTNNVTLTVTGGTKIDNSVSNFLLDVSKGYIELSYIASTNDWKVLELPSAGMDKLNNIEDNATADQTGAEIEALLDAELGSEDWKTQNKYNDVGIKTTNYTAINNDYIRASNGITITLPTTGTSIKVWDYLGEFETTNVTLTSATNIMGSSDDYILDQNNVEVELKYNGTEWRVIKNG